MKSLAKLLAISTLAACAELPTRTESAPTPRGTRVTLSERAARLHREKLPVFDGHNDLPGAMRERTLEHFDDCDLAEPRPEFHTDIPRLLTGGVGAQFWSVYVSASTEKTGDALERTLEQCDLVHRMIARYPDVFELASTADDVERIRRSGKIASLLGIEGGYSIEDSLAALRMFYALGVRYMTLTHSDTTSWADSATDAPRHGGLSEFGERVVREMNRIGMLVDISHVSVECMDDVLRVSTAPIIASHSSAFALAPHPRNVPDDILVRVAKNGGVVMVNFASGFIVRENAVKTANMFEVRRQFAEQYPDEAVRREKFREWQASLKLERGTVLDVVDHIEHIARVAGVDHVGLGSDYDGISMLPEQLEDVSGYPYITQELMNRGWSEGDILKVLGDNVLRALREAEKVAASSR
jgi:membrane dipeptidase